MIAEYKPPTARKEMIVRVQLKPAFSGKKMGELGVEGFLAKLSREYAQSSIGQILSVMRTLGIECSPVKSKVPSKMFGIDQILEEGQVLDVIENHVICKYRALCLVAAYSMLRLKDLLDMRKRDVDFKRGITLVPSKTKEKNPTPVYIPMSNKLAEAFGRIKVWPMRDDDLWFFGIVSGSVTTAVKTAFKKSGISWGSFKQFRHFGACHLLNGGVPLESIQKLLHHTKIQTTQIYARVSRGKLEEAVRVFDQKPVAADTSLTQKGG